MQSRRSFLRTGFAFVTSLALIEWAAPPVIRRHGNFYIVKGWVLTADDVTALSDHAA